MRSRALLLSLLLVALAAGPLAGADHFRSGTEALVKFDHKTGNEWWVEVLVSFESPGDSLAKVEATDDDETWHELTLKSWGAWAKSFHIEPGHLVLFRATLSSGEVVYSCWFTHPAGVERCEQAEPSPEDDDVTFDHKGGNEFWVQVDVQAVHPPDEVQVRDTDGDWTSLRYTTWGFWAGEYHVEPGHEVQFRAAAHGSMSDIYDVESCWYSHPEGVARCDGSPPPPPPPSPFHFDHAGGNEWWVEAVIQPQPVEVDAMDTGGEWKRLELKSWGEWAASFHIEPGHEVKFRARDSSGAWHESCWFSHPQGAERCVAPPPEEGTWPVEGSYARYEFEHGASIGGIRDETTFTLDFTYTDGRWQARCVGETWEDDFRTDTRERTEAFDAQVALAPPMGPTDQTVGDDAFIEGPFSCEWDRTVERIAEQTTIASQRRGEAVTAPVWHAVETGTGSCGCGRSEAWWSTISGLVLRWQEGTTNSWYRGVLLDTDAPIGEGDAYDPAPAPAWPNEASHVTIESHYWNNASAFEVHAVTTFDYEDGHWFWHCVATRTIDGGTEESRTSGAGTPLFGPTRVTTGTEIRLSGGTRSSFCGELSEFLVADALRSLDGHRVWLADETPEDDAAGEDSDAWYDVDTGLVLQWEHRSADRSFVWTGRVTSTDARLSST